MELETGHYTAMRRTIPRSFPHGLLQDFQQIKPRHSTKIRKGKWPEDCGCGFEESVWYTYYRRHTHQSDFLVSVSCVPWTQCVVRRLVSDRTADAQRSQAKGSRVEPSETKLSRMKPSEAEPS